MKHLDYRWLDPPFCNYIYTFYCKPVGLDSDSMTASSYSLIEAWWLSLARPAALHLYT